MNQREHRLSHYVDKLLDRILAEPCWYTAIDTAAKSIDGDKTKAMVWAQRRKAMGIKPSHLDWYVYQCPRFAQIELKAVAGQQEAYKALRPGQRDTMRMLGKQQIPCVAAWSIRSVYEFLRDSGFQLCPTAETIVQIIEAEYHAKDDAALVSPKKVKRIIRKFEPRYAWTHE
jgi:hypothetical protein